MEQKDVEKLFGDDIEAGHFNDDALFTIILSYDNDQFL